MFRRRPRRPGRPASQAMVRLKQAHRLMDEGQYEQAAHLFNALAEGAVRRRIPRAPFLFVQAGRATLYGGDKPQGVALIRRGLNMLAGAGRWGDLFRIGHRLAEELDEKGFQDESEKLEEWLSEVLPEKSDQVARVKADMQRQHPLLPTNCPHCGGILNSTEVTWMDDVTAECLYCGGAVRAEA